LCEKCQRQSYKAFIGLTITAKTIDEVRHLLRENLANTDPLAFKTPIFDLARSASAVTPSEKSSINTIKNSTTRFAFQ